MFSNNTGAVNSLSEIYHVGAFAHILEMRDHGSYLELVLNAHRRIRILEKLEDVPTEEVTKSISKLNGRRTRKIKEEKPKKRDIPEEAVPKEDSGKPEEPKLIFAKTENVTIDNIDRTMEMKV